MTCKMDQKCSVTARDLILVESDHWSWITQTYLSNKRGLERTFIDGILKGKTAVARDETERST